MIQSPGESEFRPQTGAVKFAMFIAGAVLLLMMGFGLVMRAAQGAIITLSPMTFYEVMTAHGAGMVATASLTGAAILWYFMGRHLDLAGAVFWAFIASFLISAALVLESVFIGGYAGAWTFLYPLPALSNNAWSHNAAATFLLGYLVLGTGFLVLYLEIGRKLIARYGGIGGALGWPTMVGRKVDPPPPSVIAAMATIIFNAIGTVAGAIVVVASIVNMYYPEFEIDALLAKNLIYFFGHVFINSTIYMAVIAVYELIPEYTGVKWKASRLFITSWSLVILYVLAVYPHHLFQDMAMPGWMMIMGQVLSYLSGIPLLAVTAFSLIVYLGKAKSMHWDLASAMLVLGVAGWSMGAVPAIIDGMISVNSVMHNTLWVPGHFHTYLILGEIAMSFGFMMWLVRRKSGAAHPRLGWLVFLAYVVGGLGFVLMFLVSGAMSVPRRWAVYAPEWISVTQIATGFAVLLITGATALFVIYVLRLRAAADR